MLKFFRKYNKWFLAIGGTLLMIAFLVQPAMSIFVPQPTDQAIGEINGEEVTLGDRVQAASELQLLENFPLLRAMLPLERSQEATQYLLMQREAAAMGISASEAEVDQVLRDMQAGPTEVAQLLQRTRVSEASLRETIRRWIAVQNYLPLVQGRSYMSLQDRMQTMMFAYQMAQMNPMQAGQILQLTQGMPRLSEPLLAHFVANQQATLAGEVVLVGHEKYLDRVGQPTDEQLTELFAEHRDNLPGESEPYGFGYRTPARVKLEWLQVPAEAIRAQVRIDEAEAMDFFEENKARYAAAEPGAAPGAGAAATTYAQARDRVLGDLRQRKAEELAAQAAKAAQNAMQEDPAVRKLTRGPQYAEVPAEFQPMPMSEAARVVEERAGVTPLVQRYADEWVPASELSSLPGIGLAQLAGRSGISFADYAASARELEPAADNPLTPLRLQRGLPSEVLRGFDGSYFVFRILEAQPAQSPESLADARDEVVEDWRSLQAYELLKADQAQLVQTAKDRGLQALNSELDAPMLSVGPVARREQSMMTMALETPSLPGIGQSDTLLDAMFATAEQVAEGEGTPTGSLTAIDEDARIGGAPVDERLSVAIYRVDSYQPITRDSYENSARSPFVGAAVDRVLLQDRVEESPLSVKAIAARIGYSGEGLEDDTAEEAGDVAVAR